VSFVRLLISLLLVGLSSRSWSQAIPDLPDRYRKDVAGERSQPLFDPLGVRLGAFLARTNGDVDIGYNSNLYGRASNVVGDGFVKLRPSARLGSDWGRHSVELSARAEITRFTKEKGQNTAEYWAHAGGLLEIGDRVSIRPNLDYSREAQARGSATNSLTVGSPLYDRTFATNVGASYDGGPFSAELLLAYRRERFEPIRVDGIEVSQQVRDTDGVGARATLLYKLTPSISALVQGVADDTRNPHPELTDIRRSHGYAVLGGVRIDPNGMIAGQLAIGFRRRFFDGSDTASTGFTYDVRLQWYPTELLTLDLKADRQFRNSGILTASAVLVDKQAADVAYEMYRDLIFHLEASRELANYRDVSARTDLKGVGLRATYTSRRMLQLSAFLRYETSSTNRPLLATQYSAMRAGISVRVRL
jgi:hypothetical protein